MVADMIRSDSLPSVTWPDAQYLPSVYGIPEAAEGPGNFSADGAGETAAHPLGPPQQPVPGGGGPPALRDLVVSVTFRTRPVPRPCIRALSG
jgi:hypothetical protein